MKTLEDVLVTMKRSRTCDAIRIELEVSNGYIAIGMMSGITSVMTLWENGKTYDEQHDYFKKYVRDIIGLEDWGDLTSYRMLEPQTLNAGDWDRMSDFVERCKDSADWINKSKPLSLVNHIECDDCKKVTSVTYTQGKADKVMQNCNHKDIVWHVQNIKWS